MARFTLRILVVTLVLLLNMNGESQAATIYAETEAFVYGSTFIQNSDTGSTESSVNASSSASAAGSDPYESSSGFAYGNITGNITATAYHSASNYDTGGPTDGPTDLPADGFGRSRVTWTDTLDLTEYTGYSYLFHVNNGSLSLSSEDQEGVHPPSGYQEAGYSIEISVNGGVVWESSAFLSATYGSGWTGSFDDAGNQLNIVGDWYSGTSGSLFQAGVLFQATDIEIDLDPYAGLEDVVVEYVVELLATDMENPDENATSYQEPGFDGQIFSASQSARFGDPAYGGGISVIGLQNSGVLAGSNPVPEPGTMVLFGFGLIGVAWMGRKRI